MNPQNLLEAAHHELSAVCDVQKALFSNGRAVQKLYAAAARTMLIRLSLYSSGSPLNIANAGGTALSELRGGLAADLPILAEVNRLLESSEDFQDAVATVQPIVDRITELETQVADEARAINAAENTLAEARAEALRKATEAAEHDPGVIAAKQALENGLGLGLGIKLEAPSKPKRQKLAVEQLAGVE